MGQVGGVYLIVGGRRLRTTDPDVTCCKGSDVCKEQPGGSALSLGNDSRGMTRKVTSSVTWTGALHSVILAVNLAFTAVLARLLAPADFGVMAGAMIFLSFAQMVLQSGIVPTLVHKRKLTVDDLRGAFTLVVMLATVIFVLLVLLAPLAAAFLRLEAIEIVLQVLAFALLIEAFGIVPETLLIRRLEVRRVMLIEICARVIGSGLVGISLAVLGWGYWALVAARMADTTFKGVALLLLVRPPLAPMVRLEALQRLAPKSAGFTLRALLNFVALNGDTAIVGRYFDVASLGLYTRAYHLMSLPAEFYGKAARRVVFPAMARVQDEPARLKAAFLRGLSLTALLGLPLCAVLVVLARDVVKLLLGGQWLGVVPIFMVLAASMYLRLGANVSGSLLNASGSVSALVIIQAIYAVTIIAGCVLAYPYGLFALAGAVATAIFLHFLVISAAGCRRAGATVMDFVSAHTHGGLLAVLTGTLTWAAAAPCWAANFEGLVPIMSSGLILSLLALVLMVRRPRILLGSNGAEFLAGMQSLVAERLLYMARRA